MAKTSRMPSYKKLRIDRGDNSPPICDQVREGIRALILDGELAPNEALMPVRKLCALLDLNRVTVDQAIRDLVQEGLLRSERGRGMFVNEVRIYTVGLVARLRRKALSGATTGYAGMLVDARKQLRRANVRTTLILRKDAEPALRFGPPLDRAITANVDAYLTVGIQNEDYLDALVDTGRPVVALDAAPLRSRFDGVVLDTLRTGYLAARHLLERGHRRLLFIGYDRGVHPGDPSGKARVVEPDSERLRAGFALALTEAGMNRAEAQYFDRLPVETDRKELRQALQDCTGGVMARSAAEALHRDKELPESFSIVVAEVSAGARMARPWTHMAFAEGAFARLGVARMLERLAERRQGSEHTPAGSLLTIEPFLADGEATPRIAPPPDLYGYHERF